MTSQTEPFFPQQHSSVANKCGDQEITALDPFVYRDMRWCMRCGGEQLFVEVYECKAGRVGVCFGCGEERVERWTRTNGEVA